MWCHIDLVHRRGHSERLIRETSEGHRNDILNAIMEADGICAFAGQSEVCFLRLASR